MDFIGDTKIDWLKYRWYFIIISAVVLLAGAFDVARKGGLQYGIDFSEGTIVYAKFENTPEIEVLRDQLQRSGVNEAIIQRYDRDALNMVMIRVERISEESVALDATANTILRVLSEDYPNNALIDSSTEIVGPIVGEELRRKARNATLFALIAMLLYIGFRFEFIYGLGATLAVIHDVTLTLSLVSIFNFEITLYLIAAFLTLVGYSVNDTIVIFDRVRENRKLVRRSTLVDIINLSINQTLRRTLLTSGLTLFVVMALYVMGGAVLRGFSFVLVAGVIIGTYSSIAIASPAVLWWRELRLNSSPGQRKQGQRSARI